jgi:hypothetical protein
MTIRCVHCDHVTEDDARFCPNCGSAVGMGAVVAVDDGGGVSDLTGVLGVRTASEGDSAPMELVTEASVGGLPEGGAVLLALRGPNEGTRIQLDPLDGPASVGRSPEAVLFLDDVTVSRRHAEFRPTDGSWTLVDVGSLNGSYVNRRRIESQRLDGGDEVQIGKYRFAFLVAHSADGDTQ